MGRQAEQTWNRAHQVRPNRGHDDDGDGDGDCFMVKMSAIP